LRYASSLLSEEQIVRAVRRDPYRINDVLNRLSDDEFNRFVADEPGLALRYASSRLDDAKFARLAAAEPGIASFIAEERMSDSLIASALTADPYRVIESAIHRLSDAQSDVALEAVRKESDRKFLRLARSQAAGLRR
jgi:hypothetical protein